METITINRMMKDVRYEGFLLVRSADKRTDSRGSQYVDMNLIDRTGEINCKVWDGNAVPPEAGTVIKVRGLVQEFNGRLQLRVEKMRPVTDTDQVDMKQLVPCAPETPETMLREIRDTVDAFESEKLKLLVTEVLNMAGEELNYYPAAQRMHHAERSGLLHHTTSMLRLARGVLEVYPWLDRELLLAGVIIHDLGKIAEMKSDKMGNVTDYTMEGQLIGHLVRGITTLNKAAEKAGVSGETVVLLEHMLLSHHGESEYGSPKPPMFPEAEMLHWLDIMDARMNAFHGVVDRTPAGAFSERIASLERRVYHPLYEK